MKVLFLAFDSEELSIRWASALAHKVDVNLVLPRKESEPHLHWLNPAVEFQPFEKARLRQPWYQLKIVATIIQQIKRFNPDVIHFQKGHLWFNLALPLLRHYPLVFSIHDPTPHIGDKESQKTPQIIRNFGFHRANQIIVHNKKMKQRVIEECQIPEEIVHIIPLIERGNSNVQEYVPEDENLILFFGRIWQYKGLEYLIKAEPLITAQIPNAKIMIAGHGDDFTPYRQMMVHPDKFLIYNEFIPHEQVAKFFGRASVVVLPYIDATQSGVIPVAYTFSKPVVATRVGGLPEQVDHGHTGFLVSPRDEQALADKIIQLLTDKELRHRLGANGRRKSDTEWSASAVAEKTIPVYERAIGITRAIMSNVQGWQTGQTLEDSNNELVRNSKNRELSKPFKTNR